MMGQVNDKAEKSMNESTSAKESTGANESTSTKESTGANESTSTKESIGANESTSRNEGMSKRKIIRCPKCGLTFSGERVYCPLCKKRIVDEKDAEKVENFDVFPVTQMKHTDSIFMKIVTFAALAAVIVAGMVDRLMAFSDRTWRPIFLLVLIGVAGGYALLMVGQRKWRNIRKMVMYEVIIGMLLCMAYDWYTGWRGWSLQVVLSLTVAGMNLLYFVLGFADRKHQTDYGIYFLITILGTLLVIVFAWTGVIHNTILVTITTGIGVLLLLAKVVFQGKTFLAELSRRLHV